MQTTVLGVRLNDYQRRSLKSIAQDKGIIEADIVRNLINNLIDGRIEPDTNVRGLVRVAKEKGVKTQKLIDMIVEQLNESSGDTE